MIILTQKLPIWLLVFIYLFSTPTLSQSDLPYSLCETAANYTKNSTFEKNLDTTLSVLSNTNSGLGFFNYSTGQGIDTVYSIALCRGDVKGSECQSCLNDTIVKARKDCPNQKEATVYDKRCLLKYSNQTILGKDQPKPYHFVLEDDTFSSDKDNFNITVRPLLNDLIATAAGGDSRRKFAVGKRLGDHTNIYGLVQCTPDLISNQCSDCLRDIINQFSIQFSSNRSVGGTTLLPMCNFRYETYSFFDESYLPGTNSSKTQGFIRVLVIVIVIVVTMITCSCIFIRLRKKQHQTPQTKITESKIQFADCIMVILTTTTILQSNDVFSVINSFYSKIK